jgi:hypothetical protein
MATGRFPAEFHHLRDALFDSDGDFLRLAEFSAQPLVTNAIVAILQTGLTSLGDESEFRFGRGDGTLFEPYPGTRPWSA